MNHYLEVLKKYAVFDGRSGRAEYWFFVLFNILVAIVLGVIDGVLGTAPMLGGLYSLAVLLPGLGVTIRRLHDTDKSGWWILIVLVPLIGGLILLFFMIQEGTRGDNRYGAVPAA